MRYNGLPTSLLKNSEKGDRNLLGGKDRNSGLTRGLIFHHNNAPARDASSVREFLAKQSIPQLERFNVLKIRESLKNMFDDTPVIDCSPTKILRSVSENEFQECFLQWHTRL